VTHIAARSPAGMHGPNMALADLPASPSLLPATAFDRCGSLPRKLPGNNRR
jgi:hypothetical protein